MLKLPSNSGSLLASSTLKRLQQMIRTPQLIRIPQLIPLEVQQRVRFQSLHLRNSIRFFSSNLIQPDRRDIFRQMKQKEKFWKQQKFALENDATKETLSKLKLMKLEDYACVTPIDQLILDSELNYCGMLLVLCGSDQTNVRYKAVKMLASVPKIALETLPKFLKMIKAQNERKGRESKEEDREEKPLPDHHHKAEDKEDVFMKEGKLEEQKGNRMIEKSEEDKMKDSPQSSLSGRKKKMSQLKQDLIGFLYSDVDFTFLFRGLVTVFEFFASREDLISNAISIYESAFPYVLAQHSNLNDANVVAMVHYYFSRLLLLDKRYQDANIKAVEALKWVEKVENEGDLKSFFLI